MKLPLQEQIDVLYAAFSDIPKPQTIEGCPCCIEDKGIDVLLSRPLREIQAEELSSYAASAFLTVGNVQDYLYFLPRILECSITGHDWWPDPEVIGRAIAETQPLQWPEKRLAALQSLLEHAIHKAMAEEPGWGADLLDKWLCATSRAGLAVIPLLHLIAASPPHTVSYFSHNQASLDRLGQLSNPFWDLPNEGHEEIIRWFHSPAVRAVLYEKLGMLLPLKD